MENDDNLEWHIYQDCYRVDLLYLGYDILIH